MKKKLFIGLAFFAVIAAATFVTVSTIKANTPKLSDLMIENLQMLSEDENQGGFDCVLKKDDCEFRIGTTVELQLVIKKFPLMVDVFVGKTIDLTDFTKLYASPSWWDILVATPKVRCGTDVTCNDLLSDIRGN